MANIRDGMSIYPHIIAQRMPRLHCKNQVFGLFKTSGNSQMRRLRRENLKTKNPAEAGFKIGRRERIRTSAPLVPNQLRYQAALLAVLLLFEFLVQFFKSWCEGGDSNPHILRTLTPEASASTNSATFAFHNFKLMGWLMGFEPTTTGITIQGSTN